MIKVSIIGAGSTVFSAQLIRDILVTPALKQGVFALVDIDSERLELAHRMAEYLVMRTGGDWRVESSLDRLRVISGSDYVINTIEVAGLANVRQDYEIPLKYGVDQCIGDTVGPGGLFKALRTLPAWLEILSDVERLAPRALVMNYTNPMSLTVLAGVRRSKLPIVGLCHSVQHTSQALSGYLQVPYDELVWDVAGINHQAWFLKLEHKGQDLYPRLKECARNPELYEQDPVRFETLLHLGAFHTESSGHGSEYSAYFRKRPDLRKKFDRGGYRGESGFYANNWPNWRSAGEQKIHKILSGEGQFELTRGIEYASKIIESIQTGNPAVIYGNVLNTGLITNLPPDGVVEVACLVDRNGIQPVHFGSLPVQLAALNVQHMAFHDLAARAILEEDREAAVHALMVDPLTAAVCSLDEIRSMFDQMVTAQKPYLPEFLSR